MKKLFITAAFLAFFGGINAQEQTTPGYTPTGFYDDFATSEAYSNQDETGVFWWETYDFDTISLLREDSSLKATVSQQKGSYTPFGVSFSSDENVQKTIDLSQEAKVKFTVFNESLEGLQVRVGLVDINGNVAEYTSEVNNDDISNAWMYTSAVSVVSGETRQVVIDLTGGYGVDYGCAGGPCLINTDFSVIKGVYITIVSSELDVEDSYHPFAIDDTKVRFYDFKVGKVDGSEKNELISKIVIPGDTTTTTPEDTVVVTSPKTAHPDSVPVLTAASLNNYGFYDDFDKDEEYTNGDGTGIYWFETYDMDTILYQRKDSVLRVNVSQQKGSYTPFGVFFSDDFNNEKTIDLTYQTQIKFKAFNESSDSLQIRVSVIDTLGNEAAYTAMVNENPDLFWAYESATRIGSGETRDVIIDLTGGNGIDFTNFNCGSNYCLTNTDFSVIKAVYLTIINSELEPETYMPLAISNAKVTFYDFGVGRFDQQEKDVLLSDIYVPEDTTSGGDTTVIVNNPTVHPDSVPVLTGVGVHDYGFYYVPKAQGFNWWAPQSTDGSFYEIGENDNNMFATVHKTKGNWDPMGLSFTDTLDNPTTIDVSAFAELEIAINNPANEDYKLWFQLMDEDGNTASYYDDVIENPYFWEFEPAYILSPGEETIVNMDLTNLHSFDWLDQKAVAINLSKISSFVITVINKELDHEDNYLPFGIDSAVVEIAYIKLGKLEQTGALVSNVLDVTKYENVLELYGCMDIGADNYNAEANRDNGSCTYAVLPQIVNGCTIDSALNYNENANADNGTCIFKQENVQDVSPLVKAGVVRKTLVEAKSIKTVCEIDYTKIVDQVKIVAVNEINANEVEVVWEVSQKEKKIAVKSIVAKEKIKGDVLVKQKLTCSSTSVRMTGFGEGIDIIGEVSEQEIVTGIISNSEGFAISIYPNPVQSQLSISEAGSLTIYSADGIEMLQETVEAGSSVNVANWSNGIYFVKLINESGEFTTSFVKQ